MQNKSGSKDCSNPCFVIDCASLSYSAFHSRISAHFAYPGKSIPKQRSARERVKTAPEISRGLLISPKMIFTGKKQRDDFSCQGHSNRSLAACSGALLQFGGEGKEAAPPTDLQGELRKEKLITGAEHWPSHQTQHFCILKNYHVIFRDHRWSGAW